MASSIYPLQRYFEKHPEMTKTALANRAGTSPAKICDLIDGRLRRPSPELAKKLDEVTKGEVTMEELLFFRPVKSRTKSKLRRKAS